MPCISCSSALNKEKFNLGKQTKCNSFFKNKAEYNKLKKFRIAIGSCKKCSLIQVLRPINYRDLIPKYSWMTNNEEDSYHENYIKHLLKKKILKKNFKILGVSNFDKTYLKILRANNFKNIKTINLRKDLNVLEKFSHRQEVIQNYLSEKNIKNFTKINGKFDLIVCSKLLEHTQNIKSLMNFFKGIMKENSLILIDVPDSKKSLEQGNVSMIWEEHISYFTPKTLHNTLSINGFKKKFSKIFFFKQENNLVFLCKKNLKKGYLYNEQKLLPIFKKKTNIIKGKLIRTLKNLNKNNFINVIYGAGHNSIAFINFLDLSSLISYIVYDDPRKKNFKVTSNKISVKSFNYLKQKNKKFAFFLGTSIKSENKIKKTVSQIQKFKLFSLYPDSKLFFK